MNTPDNHLEIKDLNGGSEESVHPLAAWEVGVIRSRDLVLFRAYPGANDQEDAGPYYSLTPEQAVNLSRSLDDALRDLAASSRHKSSH